MDYGFAEFFGWTGIKDGPEIKTIPINMGWKTTKGVVDFAAVYSLAPWSGCSGNRMG